MVSSLRRREGNARKRYERNRCVDQVYTGRVILGDNDGDGEDHTLVEDAILSSLGDGTYLNQRDWLTHLGRQWDGSTGGTGGADGVHDEQDYYTDYSDAESSSLPSKVLVSNFETAEFHNNNISNEIENNHDNNAAYLVGGDVHDTFPKMSASSGNATATTLSTGTTVKNLAYLQAGIKNRSKRVHGCIRQRRMVMAAGNIGKNEMPSSLSHPPINHGGDTSSLWRTMTTNKTDANIISSQDNRIDIEDLVLEGEEEEDSGIAADATEQQRHTIFSTVKRCGVDCDDGRDCKKHNSTTHGVRHIVPQKTAQDQKIDTSNNVGKIGNEIMFSSTPTTATTAGNHDNNTTMPQTTTNSTVTTHTITNPTTITDTNPNPNPTLLQQGSTYSSSVALFYHALEEIQKNIQKKTSNTLLEDAEKEDGNQGRRVAAAAFSSAIPTKGDRITGSRCNSKYRDRKWYEDFKKKKIASSLCSSSLSRGRRHHRYRLQTAVGRNSAAALEDGSDNDDDDIDDGHDQAVETVFSLAKQTVHLFTLKQKICVGMAMLCFTLFHMAWFGFGCYGIYCSLSSYSHPAPLRTIAKQPPNIPFPEQQVVREINNEIVIRVVREVKYVNDDYLELDDNGDDNKIEQRIVDTAVDAAVDAIQSTILTSSSKQK